ncbi:MAG: ATP-binding protein [Clostridia bacterium]|nr:ATP-binding protein [Clostridia bacterium]
MREITIEAKVDNLPQVLEFLDSELEEMGCGLKTQMQLDVAVEELYVNVASYAYGEPGGAATIRIERLDNPKAVTITLIDSGIPYDPLAKEDPDVTLSAEERGIGGLGIYMAKNAMDEMYYERKDGMNILKMIKKL